MLTILDRYILRKFLGTFVFTLLLITVIAVVIDTSEKADDFVRSGMTAWQLVRNYYIGFVPFIMSMIFPLMVFIAVIYFSSKMAGRSEFIAILAGGVRYQRMLRPYVIGSVFLALIFWMASQYWVPRANEIRTNFQAVYVDRNSSYTSDPYRNTNYYLRVDPVTFVGFRYYDTTNKTANSFFLQKIRDNKVYYNLRAETIRWDEKRSEWLLYNAIEHKFDGLKESVRKIDTMSINLNVKPRELRRDDYLKDKLTTPELKQFIRMEEIRGSEGLNTFKVEYYHRDATPFSVIIMTLIGAVVASRKIRGGSGLHLAYGIVTAAIFVVMDKFSVTFSTKGDFPPMLAAWLPNIIFGGVACWLYVRTPK
ncbi:MAG: LptF/LptG family permease [Bacteroidota bacterium]|nr:LptF/LptG family permease [Bacteroidota bacterium]MDP4215353.1 LptF/LptG family permease [Bacteroidota bacterium]MDP4245417.1 LptF/LptG family permease [Bacteroidota bacterium]MDP4255762.1 LptF/LptG family permease [Bacteroidota bacterium]MDP4258782.1 LptF/LptG family permease [Bacteroidota bacterium]